MTIYHLLHARGAREKVSGDWATAPAERGCKGLGSAWTGQVRMSELAWPGMERATVADKLR